MEEARIKATLKHKKWADKNKEHLRRYAAMRRNLPHVAKKRAEWEKSERGKALRKASRERYENSDGGKNTRRNHELFPTLRGIESYTVKNMVAEMH